VSPTPEISVVIPTRNRWRALSTTLASALGQEGVEHEVIVVDDASTDGTPERLAQMDAPRVRIIRHPARRHVAAARNSGIEAARGAWVAFLDDDDLWAPHKLRLQLAAASTPETVMAYAAAVMVDPDRSLLATRAAPPPDGLLPMLLRGNWIPVGASNVIARTQVVKRLRGFDERLRHFADWDMWIRLAAEGSAAACPEPLAAYVVHPHNMLLSDSRHVPKEFGVMLRKHRARAGEYGVAPDRIFPDEMGVYRWLGWTHARAGRRTRASLWYLRASARRSPYGRRRSLRDAGRALRGEVSVEGAASIDERAAAQANWLDRLA
jgi:glycosyltransferase involved in cell wall biosynthesis